MQNDVMNKAIEANPIKVSGMVFSVIPTGAMAKEERPNYLDNMSPSGANVLYGDRFDDVSYYA